MNAILYLFYAILALATLKLLTQLSLSIAYNLKRRCNAGVGFFPKISIVVLAYNEEKTIRGCVKSLLNLDYPNYEVIVVDDGSTDRTYEELRRISGIKFIHQANQGKPAALNNGVRKSTGEIILTVDADTFLNNHALKNLAIRFAANQELGAVAGNVKVNAKPKLLNVIQSCEYAIGINLNRKGQSVLGCVTIVPGPVAALKREAIEKAGYFSDDTFAEDFDITLKILKCGYKVEYAEASLAYTDAPKTVEDLLKQRRRWYRGMIQVLDKHRDMYFNHKFGAAGLFGVPNLWFDSISPFLNVALLLVTLLTWIATGETYFSLFGVAFFLAISVAVGAVALSLEPRREKRNYLALPLLLFYNMFLDGIRVMSLSEEMVSIIMEWEKPKR